ncbi:organic cation transporter protein-like [Chrysoperla carnea]|uniref:organic cation transporter protein-like n=1 Tax=Chrysoperla carnea TaxID=189513 RepID=UPI001D0874FF|nr:organic cation transporter protein-like [Chrysoperla carnea]
MSEKQNFCLENIINDLNGFGRYQKFSLMLLCVPVIFSSYVTFAYFFTTGIPNYRCRISECDNGTALEYISECVKSAIPFENGYPTYCTRYGVTNNVLGSNNISFSIEKIIRCENDLVFPDKHTTLVNDFQIYCPNNQWKLTTVGTINAIGQSIGAPIMGFISDRYGRKIALVVLPTLTSIFGIIQSFSTSLEFYYITEFVFALVGSTTFSIAFILIVEITGTSYKLFSIAVCCIAYAIGEIVVGITAWYFTTWQLFLRVLYMPGLVMIFYWWLIPESIECKKTKPGILDQGYYGSYQTASYGSRVIGNVFTRKNAEVLNNDNKPDSIINILMNRTIFWRLINCSIIMFLTLFLYTGLSINSSSISDNKYLAFIFAASIEIPAYITCSIILSYLGFKRTLTIASLAAGILCISLYFIPEGIPKLIIFILGKFMITLTYQTCYVFVTELFPITIRNLSLGICFGVGNFGNMVSPQTLLLALIWHPLPMIVFGLCAILISFLSILLPNKMHK